MSAHFYATATGEITYPAGIRADRAAKLESIMRPLRVSLAGGGDGDGEDKPKLRLGWLQ